MVKRAWLALLLTSCFGAAGDMTDDAPDASQPAADAGVLPTSSPDSGSDAGLATIDAGPARTSVYIIGLNPSGYGRSVDGVTWTHLQALDRKDAGVVTGDNAVTSVAFGLGLVIAVGDSGISVSRDGRTWDNVMPSRLHSAVAVFGFGQFFVLSGGDVWSSPDGFTWQKKTGTGDATHWHSVVFGKVAGVDTLIGVGDQWEFVTDGGPAVAPHRLKKTTDGLTWDYVAAHRDTPEGNEQIDRVLIGNDFALGVGTHAGTVYRFDGTHFEAWQKLMLPSDGGTPMNLSASAFANGQFVFAGTGPYSYNTGATTADAHTWRIYPTTKGDAGVPIDFVPFPVYGRMGWTGSRFYGPFPFHTDARFAWSTDGVSWSADWLPSDAEKALGSISAIGYGELLE